MTVDAHSHYMPPEVAANTAFFKQFWSDADGQLRLMDEYHVDQAVLLYPTSDAHLKMGGWQAVCKIYNQRIADLVKARAGRFIGGGILPVDQPASIQAELTRIKDLGLKVLSLASSYEGKYLDDPVFDEVFDFAARHKMPVHVHPQIMNPIGTERLQDPLLSPVLEYVFDVSVCIGKMMMSGVFIKHPGVNFIFAHFGGVLPIVKERFDSTYGMLRRRQFVKDLGKTPGEYFSRLYFDMSGTRSVGALQTALEMADAGHILWGSDFPANQNFKDSLGVVSQQVLSADTRNLILGQNFKSLLA
ncbi:MAG: amidohydrolase [Candidatus Omnitrophica bacterium]|nr:amidohydrolase [Candidatus Omnitrophota bacterium]